MWMASPLPLLASTFEIFMLRTMSLLTPLMFRPQPVRPEPDPTPRTVLLDVSRTSSEQVKLPLTRMVSAPLAAASVVSADRLVTVTVGPLPPPVVPPFIVAQPTRPLVLPGGGEVGGL